MSTMRVLVGAAVFVACGVVFAQTNDTKPNDVTPGPAEGRVSTPQAADPCGTGAKALDQLEILTDTMGVDFRPYLTAITKRVRQTWYDVMPASVYPPVKKQGKLSIEFLVQKNGKVTNMKIHTTFGDVALDRAAWRAIIGSSPFASLPKEFTGEQLGLRFYFFYNLSPETATIHISPCVDVRVAAGSMLQFSASGEDVTQSALQWRVHGSGCLNSACGTISDTGLYTAPAELPNPPTVIVETIDRTHAWLSGEIKVTVVPAKPPK